MSDDSSNSKYIPSAFLYMMTGADFYSSELRELQKQNKYWQEDTNKFYDTALSLLALYGTTVEEETNAKEYLLSIQEDSGCWNSDTAFILHSAWPKSPSSGGGTTSSGCEEFNHYCVSTGDCSLQNILDNFDCDSSADICCALEPELETCDEKQGMVCDDGYECTGSLVVAEGTTECCLGSCLEAVNENECEQEDSGYVCRGECFDDEEEKSFSCTGIKKCCASKESSGGSMFWIIVLLIILIILVVLAIIFRNQLKIWLFKIKSKFKSGKAPTPSQRPSPPGFPQPMRRILPSRPPIGRTIPSRIPARETQKNSSKKSSSNDKDFDETMRKLRDMTK
jgi:hypothetical protein